MVYVYAFFMIKNLPYVAYVISEFSRAKLAQWLFGGLHGNSFLKIFDQFFLGGWEGVCIFVNILRNMSGIFQAAKISPLNLK